MRIRGAGANEPKLRITAPAPDPYNFIKDLEKFYREKAMVASILEKFYREKAMVASILAKFFREKAMVASILEIL
jgi:hypothetical protein